MDVFQKTMSPVRLRQEQVLLLQRQLTDKYGPVLSVENMAEIFGVTKTTLYGYISPKSRKRSENLGILPMPDCGAKRSWSVLRVAEFLAQKASE